MLQLSSTNYSHLNLMTSIIYFEQQDQWNASELHFFVVFHTLWTIIQSVDNFRKNILQKEMQAYSYLNNLLLKRDSTYQEFEHHLQRIAVQTETYLNLFLVTVVSSKGNSPDFEKYVHLLTHFSHFTGKKSANINYIGYKDRKNILMHAAHKGTPQAVKLLLAYHVEIEVADPQGRNAAFYAVRNSSEASSNAILILLLGRCPNLLMRETVQGGTLLNEAVETLRVSTIELLLKLGANPNHKLRDSGNTVSHQLLRLDTHNREAVLSILVLLAKYKANFEQPNNENTSFSELAGKAGIHFQDYAIFCALLERDESVVEDTDNEFDKMSLTTLNQPTKGGDTCSEINCSDSHLYSNRVDFSELDQLSPHDPQEPSWICSDDEADSSLYSQVEEVNYQQLSRQIISFAEQQAQVHQAMMPIAQHFLSMMSRVARKHKLSIDIVGSFATGLWSPRSDINISLVPLSNDYLNFSTTLEKIFKYFKSRKQQLDISDIYFSKGKISSIKLTLSERYQHQMFDIAIFHRNHLNQQYVSYIIQSLTAFPEIKTLFFVYREMCQTFGLNDPQAGGLKTYALFMMINSVVKSTPTKNVGELFYHVALYYGFHFEFSFEPEHLSQPAQPTIASTASNASNLSGLSLEGDLLQYPAMRFNLIDPFNHKNNIGGKHTKAKQLQNMFRSINYWLSQPAQKEYLPQLFQLNQLF